VVRLQTIKFHPAASHGRRRREGAESCYFLSDSCKFLIATLEIKNIEDFHFEL